MSQSDPELVDTLAERCAALVLREFGVARVRLKLGKSDAMSSARSVGVILVGMILAGMIIKRTRGGEEKID